jgi:hypothetical protein
VTQNQTGRGHEARRRERRCLMGVILAIGLSASAIVHGDDDQDRLKRLVDQVARGDDVEAAAAGERLVELITAPLA